MTADSTVAQFIGWGARTGELHFDGYQPLRRWSVEQLEDFWAAVWDFHVDHVSCSPVRVPIARVAAAHAAVRDADVVRAGT